MPNKNTHFKTRYSSWIIRGVFSYILLAIGVFFALEIELPENGKDRLLLLALVGLPYLIISWAMLSASVKEAHMIRCREDQLEYLSFPYLYFRKVKRRDIKGYSKSEVSYLRPSGLGGTTDPVKMIILYLKNGRKVHLTKYNFKDLYQVEKGLKQFGLSRLGKEESPYKQSKGFLPKYKY